MVDKRLESLGSMAHAVLRRFAPLDGPARDRLARVVLMPRSDDAERVFDEDLGPVLAPRVAHLWATQPMAPGPSRPAQTEVEVVGSWSQDLARAGDQPGQMVRLAPWLRPDFAWFSWRYHRPGQREGTAFEGLVWVGDHWAWFPRALRLVHMPLPEVESGQ